MTDLCSQSFDPVLGKLKGKVGINSVSYKRRTPARRISEHAMSVVLRVLESKDPVLPQSRTCTWAGQKPKATDLRVLACTLNCHSSGMADTRLSAQPQA